MGKRGKRILALAMSACMIMGSAVTAFADDTPPTTTGEAPIYSFDVTNVVVPTTLTVAFNPEGLEVKVSSDGATSQAQVLSQGMGIINKSSKDKTVQVAFKATDKNADNAITFAKSADEVTSAAKGSYVLYLTAVPATSFTLSSGTLDKGTEASALGNVTMTGVEDKAVVIADTGTLGFCLAKAVYSPKSGSEVTLGTTAGNDVQANYDLGSIDTTNGIAAFKFSGSMNTNTSWSKLTQGVTITATYTFDDVAEATPTYGIVDMNVAPTFAAGTDVGTITYTAGTGNNGLKEIKSIIMKIGNDPYDGYHAYKTLWADATDVSGTITFDSNCIGYFNASDTVEATITYETNGGEEKTATVDVKTKTTE